MFSPKLTLYVVNAFSAQALLIRGQGFELMATDFNDNLNQSKEKEVVKTL